MNTKILIVILLSSFFTSYAQNSVAFQLDALNRQTLTTYSNGTIVQYCYDELGNRTCKTIQVTAPPTIDLTFTNAPTVIPTTVGAGSNTMLNGALNNTGTGAAGASVVKYFLSNNNTLGGGDTLLNSTYVSSVAAAGSFSLTSVALSIPSSTTSGTYYIIVVADADATVAESTENNNIAVIQITVVNCTGLSVTFNVTNTTCGNSNGAVSATGTGGQQPYSYLWGNGSSSASLSSLTAGSYTVTVTAANGCTVSNTATVNSSLGITASVSTTTTSCLSNTGTATVSASGATTYTYHWSNNAATSAISNLGVGTYTVTVTGNTTCTTTANGTVAYTNSGGNSIPLSIGNDTSICIGATVTRTASNGFASYLWSNGQTTQTVTLSNLPVGQNVITIIADACGTVSKDTAIITVVALPTVILSATSSLCKNASSITLTGSPSGGIYSGTGITGNQFNPANALIGSNAITYTYTNGTGCSSTATATINVLPTVAPDITIQPNKTTACSLDTVTLTANVVNGGTTPFYQWQKNGVNVGSNSAIYTAINPTGTDVFRCVLVSNIGCASPANDTSNNVSITVVPSVTPTISIVATNVNYCTNQLFSWSATTTNAGSNPSYEWYIGGVPQGVNSSSYSTAMALPLFGGASVTCVLTSSANCASPQTVTSNTLITPPVGFPASIGQPQGASTACVGDTSTYTTSPGGSTSISWSVNNGLIIAGQGTTSVSIVWQQAGNNLIAVIGSNACGGNIVNQEKIVTVGAPSDITVTTNTTTVCDNTSPVFTAAVTSPGTNPVYQWKLNGTNVGFNTNTYTLTNPVTGNTVSCVYTSTNSCSANPSDTSNTISITVLPSPAIPVITMNPSVWCGNNPAYLQTSLCSSCTYNWSVTITIPFIGTITTPLPYNTGSIPVGDVNIPSGGTATIQVIAHNTSGCTSAYSAPYTNPINYPNAYTTQQATTCQNSPYNFNGTLLFSSGIYTDTLPSAVGCDSIITLTLSVIPSSFTNLFASICQGDVYVFKGQNLSTGGIYRDTLTSSTGCDSVIELTLNVNSPTSSSFSQHICQGTSYAFNGQSLTVTGLYNDTITNSTGCDSIITLNLSVTNFLSSSYSANICQGNFYSFNNQNITTSGSYNDTLSSSGGCDSIVTLILSVNIPTFSSFNQHICHGSSYAFNGQNLTAAGVYTDTLINSTGCDSIITLNLFVDASPNEPIVTALGDTMFCLGDSVILQTPDLGHSYLWNNTATTTSITVNTSGTYHVMAINQCGNATSNDINVTVYNLPAQPAILQSGDTLSSSVTASSYQWYYNQSILNGAINQSVTASQNGNYVVEITDANGCKNTSSLYNFTSVGIIENLLPFTTQIIPNPNTGQFTIQFSDNTPHNISITDVLGRILVKETVSGTKQFTNQDWADGIYFLNVNSLFKTSSLKFVITK